MEVQEASVTPPTAPHVSIPPLSATSSSSKLKNSSASSSEQTTVHLPVLASPASPSDASLLFEESQQKEKKNVIKLKLLGVTDEEMKRWSALKKMGLTDEDFSKGAQYAAETSIIGTENLTKVEKLTGYTERQQKRCKAVKTLGTTEEEIIEVRSQVLGKIGQNPHEQEASYYETSPKATASQFPKLKRWSSM